MRILVYGLNFFPELIGVGKYTGEFAGWLAARGHEIRVVTAPPYYPHWKIGEGYSGWRYSTEQRESMKIIRCPLWVPRKPGFFSRIVHLKSFAISSFPVIVWQALRYHPDVIFTVAPTILCAPAAIVASRLVHASSWLHFQDIETEAAFGLRHPGRIPSGFIRKTIQRSEGWLLKKIGRISGISEKMVLRLSEKGALRTPPVVFKNWVDLKAFSPDPCREKLKIEFGFPSDAFIVLYSGNVGAKQGLEIIAETVRLMDPQRKIQFIVSGTGAFLDELVDRSAGLDIHFLHLQPVERFSDFLNMADMHLVPQLAGVADAVMPSKLLPIFAVGGAAIAVVQEGTGLYNVVREAGGVTTPPGDAAALAQTIIRLCDNPEQLQKMRGKAREYAERNFDQRTILPGIEKQMKEMLKNGDNVR